MIGIKVSKAEWMEDPDSDAAWKEKEMPVSFDDVEMGGKDVDAAEVIASAIRSASMAIGTGSAMGGPGAIELVAIEIREGTKRIADALHDLAEAARGN